MRLCLYLLVHTFLIVLIFAFVLNLLLMASMCHLVLCNDLSNNKKKEQYFQKSHTHLRNNQYRYR